MAARLKQRKGLPSGNLTNLVSLRRIDSVIAGVSSYLRRPPRVKMPKIPKTHPLGKVFWTVQFDNKALGFKKKKDAKQFQELLFTSLARTESVMIRYEVTDEGYIAEHGD